MLSNVSRASKIASVIGGVVLLSACGQNGPDTPSSNGVNVTDTKVAPVVKVQLLDSMKGTLACESTAQWPAFERAYNLKTVDGKLVHQDVDESGVTQEQWTVTHDAEANVIKISGYYLNGDRRPEVSFNGDLKNGMLKVSGKRGNRDCTYEAVAR